MGGKLWKSMPLPGVYVGVALVLGLAGCASVAPQEVKPPVAMPATWQQATPQAQAASPLPGDGWWQGFGSAELDRLQALALAGSPDVRIAAERVRQAEWTVRQSGASLFPSLNLSASTSGRVSEPAGGGDTVRGENSSAGLSVSYEVDLWGRVRAGVRGAEAALDGSRFDLETARLTLTSGVANAYFQYLGLQHRVEVARQNLVLAQRLMGIVETRARWGAASALDVSRQRTTVLSQQAALLPLEAQLTQTRHALALLAGQMPGELSLLPARIQQVRVPEVATGLPATLLSRRPDLAKAEATVRSADASLDQARAALLPSVQLQAGGSLSSNLLLSLADPARALSLTGSLAQSVFDGGRLRAQVGSSESARAQAWEGYRKALLTAVKEVEDALLTVARLRNQRQQQAAIRDEAQRALTLAEQRFRSGAVGLSDVLDAQRSYYSAEDEVAQLQQAHLTATVDLIKALGGGWQRPVAPATTVAPSGKESST